MKAQGSNNGAGTGQLKEMPGTYPHFSLAILLLYGMNTGLSKFTQAAGIQFPSALIGRYSCLTTTETTQVMCFDLCPTYSHLSSFYVGCVNIKFHIQSPTMNVVLCVEHFCHYITSIAPGPKQAQPA